MSRTRDVIENHVSLDFPLISSRKVLRKGDVLNDVKWCEVACFHVCLSHSDGACCLILMPSSWCHGASHQCSCVLVTPWRFWCRCKDAKMPIITCEETQWWCSCQVSDAKLPIFMCVGYTMMVLMQRCQTSHDHVLTCTQTYISRHRWSDRQTHGCVKEWRNVARVC